MRFIIAYLSIFVLGIFSTLLVETILYDNVTPQLVFSAILFAAPVILVASTLGEIFTGLAKKLVTSHLLYGASLTGLLQQSSF